MIPFRCTHGEDHRTHSIYFLAPIIHNSGLCRSISSVDIARYFVLMLSGLAKTNQRLLIGSHPPPRAYRSMRNTAPPLYHRNSSSTLFDTPPYPVVTPPFSPTSPHLPPPAAQCRSLPSQIIYTSSRLTKLPYHTKRPSHLCVVRGPPAPSRCSTIPYGSFVPR